MPLSDTWRWRLSRIGPATRGWPRGGVETTGGVAALCSGNVAIGPLAGLACGDESHNGISDAVCDHRCNALRCDGEPALACLSNSRTEVRMAFSIKKTVAAVVSGAAIVFAGVAIAQQQQFVTVGTGGVTGVYYPTGGAICRLVNQSQAEHGFRCSAGIDRWIGFQHQHYPCRRARFRRGPVGRSI